ncbi:GRIP and coiled-coil domain-containing protein 1-like isoform X2 [Pomacea canaliculata]|nr:GRIP and coiled-coil domain-containing protein 1-like isoform X2 [Pomacea canaliculata]XP_025105949.1 GRIP and coiled-coil domain-containing protein 1-like isoform X2 [Pomacea canaliculata]
MDRAGRNDSRKTIESLKDQLQQYKDKLRDVVAAYKSLAKEKEALEASLAALSSSDMARGDRMCGEAVTSREPQNAAHIASSEAAADPLGVTQPSDDGTPQMKALKEQLRILTVSMTTLTQEKNRIESQFLADNKQLRQDNEELMRKAEEDRVLWSAKKETLEQQIQELKSRIRGLQLEREKEQTDYAVMLRELQKLLSEERLQKEALELQLDEMRRTLYEQNTNNIVLEEYEKKIRELSQELNSVRDRMQRAEIKASQPSPFVLELQKEMVEMKNEHQRIVSQEQHKATEAEHRLQQHSTQSEERISSLEEKLSELSEVVGNYERLRFQDQQAINKLKERVTQLDIENTALVRASKPYSGNSNEDEHLDVHALFDQILHLKKTLLAANQKSEKPLDLSELFTLESQVKNECTSCEYLKEELEQLKEDYERYKLRAQSVLKNKHKEKSSSKEVDILKEQVSDLRERLKTSSTHHQEEVEQLQLKIDSLSRSMLAQADAHKAELGHLKNAHQKEIFVLEQEAKKQRERTVALLAEKDQEIENLRSSSHDYYSRMKDLSLESLHDGDGLLQGEADVNDTVAQLLMQPPAQGEATLLHFAQEKARQDVEIVGLRRHKHQLENALRELQHSMSLKEEKSQDALQKLEEQIHKLERDKSRESANLEYLKNVFLKFLVSTSYDTHGRTQMLKAIATILQFSPAEKELVKSNVHMKL